jgi:hypothetical protein
LRSVISEEQRPAFPGVDDRARLAQRRATPAAAETAEMLGNRLAHIRRAVHDDGTRQRVVVEASVEAAQAQRVTVAAIVGLGCLEEPQARHLAAFDVREAFGDRLAVLRPWATSSWNSSRPRATSNTHSRGWVDGNE